MKDERVESESSVLSTSVTAVCCLPHHTLLSGAGGDVFVWRRQGEDEQGKWSVEKRLSGVLERTVHGLVPDAAAKRILVYGANRYTLLRMAYDSQNCNVVRMGVSSECEDWVMDGCWLETSEQFVLLTAHSKLLCIDPRTGLVSATAISSDRSLLYCGKLVYSDWSKLIILGGTVHNEIIVWGPPTSHTLQPIASLPGHKGVIFSVRYDEGCRRICSTSDDRTCRLWQVVLSEENSWQGAEFHVLVTVYAHKARVWHSTFLSDTTHFATIGEDGGVMVWDERGKCVSQSWLESSVLCVESITASSSNTVGVRHVLVVGCTDGAVAFLPVSLSPISTFTMEECVDVKDVRLCDDGSVLACKQTGELLMMNSERTTFTNVYTLHSGSYRLITMSPSRLHLATAHITDTISIFSVGSGGGVELIVENEKVHDGRIYSLHWLTHCLLLVCGPSGLLTLLLLQLTEERERRVISQGRLRLPDSKERWTTCCCHVALLPEDSITGTTRYLVCGDRIGSIHLYRYTLQHLDPYSHLRCSSEGVDEPVHSLWRIHGTKGVTCVIQTEHGYLLSCGRDGTVRKYLVRHDSLTVLLTVRLTVDWPSAFLTSPSFGLLIVAFHNVYLCVWSLREQRNIVKIKCWGGHRSWDVCLDRDNNFTLVFVKDKTVELLRQPLHTMALPVPLVGLHCRTINGCTRIHDLYITGGEDTTVRTCHVGSHGTLQHVCQVGSHVSSVRDVVLVPSHQDLSSTHKALIVTVGGRAQIKLWSLSHTGEVCEVSSHMVREEKDLLRDWRSCQPLDQPEVRYMSVSVIHTSLSLHTHFLLTAASDSLIRVFGVRREKPELDLVDSWAVSGENEEKDEPGSRRRCLLKVCCVHLKKEADHLLTLVVTSSTDGYLTFYLLSFHCSDEKLLRKRRVKRIKCHQGGVNALSIVRMTNDTDNGFSLLVVSGGEDACLLVSLITLHSGTSALTFVSTFSLSTLHSSQITGVEVEGRFIISTGLDGRICLTSWTLREGDQQLICKHLTTRLSLIPDIHGLRSSLDSDGRSLSVCVFGIGVETIDFHLPSDSS